MIILAQETPFTKALEIAIQHDNSVHDGKMTALHWQQRIDIHTNQSLHEVFCPVCQPSYQEDQKGES